MNLNINKDDSSINDFLYCWDVFKKRPNRIVLHNTYSSVLFREKISSKEENIFTEIIPSDDSYIINDKVLCKINDSIYLSYVIIDKLQDNSIISEITFFYKDSNELPEIETIINEIEESVIDFEEDESNKLNMVSVSNGVLDIEPIDRKDIESIEMYYNNKTFKDINKIIKSIKKNQRSINILSGEKGTGKTTMINYLSSKLDRIAIYIPNNMIELTINNPEFLKFLKRFHKPIIIIDDCELLFNESFSSSNILSNSLLQMVDGLNSIDVSFIMLYNCSINEIDSNLLISNSVVNVVEFNLLSIEESNELSKLLGFKGKYKNKTKLVDIIRNRKDSNGMKIGFL